MDAQRMDAQQQAVQRVGVEQFMIVFPLGTIALLHMHVLNPFYRGSLRLFTAIITINMNRLIRISVVLLSLFLYGCKTEPVPVPEPEEAGLDLSGWNLDFEVRHPSSNSFPAHWYASGERFVSSLDHMEKQSGLLSFKVERLSDPHNSGPFRLIGKNLPREDFAGKIVEFKGWIKTKNVQNGYAGLWFMVWGENDVLLGSDGMFFRGLIGDNDWTQVSITMDVSKEAKTIQFGASLYGTGTAWFDNFEIVICPKPKTSLSQEEVAALKRYIYPLRTYEPDGGDTKDLAILDELIGRSKVVGLGENSHGSSEIFKMKNRMIQYMAIHHGFNIFSIEASMPESFKLNDYTVRGEGNPRNLIAGMHFWTCRHEEMLDMVEWMHRFNQPTPRIIYTGFDMQYYSGAVNELYSAFQGDIEAETMIADLREKLVGRAGINAIHPVLLLLQDRIENSSFKPPQQAWLLQNIVVIRQYLTPRLGVLRDKFMADNIMWIEGQNPDSKLAVWAHNFHVARTENVTGYHLAQKYGEAYTSFGFTFYEGSYWARGSRGDGSYDAVTAYPGTIEFFLNQLDEPIFILDLKRIRADNHKDTQWLREHIFYREADEIGDRRLSEFTFRKIVDDFDYLIFIKKSSPAAIFWVD